MAEPLIKVAARSFSKHPVLRSELLAAFPNTVFNEEGARFDGDELIGYLAGADGAVIGLEPITDAVLGRLPGPADRLEIRVGLDGIDQEACARRQVAVRWTPGLNKRGVAEMALCFMLGMARNIFVSHQQVRDGNWDKDGGTLFSGRTVGIIGVGHIGKELVGLLRPFGCTILANDIIDQADYYAGQRAHRSQQGDDLRRGGFHHGPYPTR